MLLKCHIAVATTTVSVTVASTIQPLQSLLLLFLSLLQRLLLLELEEANHSNNYYFIGKNYTVIEFDIVLVVIRNRLSVK